MKKVLSLTIAFMMAVSLTACGNSSQAQQSPAQSESRSAISQNPSGSQSSSTPESSGKSSSCKGNVDAASNVRVRFSFDSENIVVDTNDSPTSRDFLSMLPLTITFKNYSESEKIGYPPRKLSTQGASAGCDSEVGDLDLFAPWGNLVLYYGDAGYYDGIIKMGHAESGIEKLANMNKDFTVKIERVD